MTTWFRRHYHGYLIAYWEIKLSLARHRGRWDAVDTAMTRRDDHTRAFVKIVTGQ